LCLKLGRVVGLKISPFRPLTENRDANVFWV
jgi:hypothetical protein